MVEANADERWAVPEPAVGSGGVGADALEGAACGCQQRAQMLGEHLDRRAIGGGIREVQGDLEPARHLVPPAAEQAAVRGRDMVVDLRSGR